MSEEPFQEIQMLNKDYEKLVRDKDNAYWERNQLVAALSKVFPSHLARHPDEDKDWENDWRNIVVIYIPHTEEQIARVKDLAPGTMWKGQQLTWHVHDFDMALFDHLQPNPAHWWDGHTTQEKYRRLRTLKPTPPQGAKGKA